MAVIYAFCGQTGKMSREHVFPQWLSRAGMADEYSMDRGGRWVTTPLMEVVTKRVCVECNTGWMSKLEVKTQPVIEGLLDESRTVISDVDRWLISRWFTKTVLTEQLAMTARDQAGPLHPDGYRAFYLNAQPAQNQFTFIAGYVGPLPPLELEIVAPDEDTRSGPHLLSVRAIDPAAGVLRRRRRRQAAGAASV